MPGMIILISVLGILYVLLALWCAFDSFERTEYGMIWVFFFIVLGPIFIPIYLFMRFYADRPVPARERLARDLEREKWRDLRIAGELERARFVEQALQGPGTMYQPEVGLTIRPDGYRHFADERAEVLLNEQRHDEAWDYLIDLYSLARSEGDLRGMDTYRFYICQLPEGAALLAEWERSAERLAHTGSSAPASSVPLDSTRSRDRRDVPF